MRIAYLKSTIAVCFFSLATLCRALTQQEALAEQAKLDQESRQVEAEKARLNQATDAWNSRCLGQAENSPAGRQCLADYSRLEAWKARVRADIADFNRRQADLNRRVETAIAASRSSNAGKQLKSSQYHGQAAATSKSAEAASAEARKVFDDSRGATNQGSPDSMTVDARGLSSKPDPVVTEKALQKHPEMRQQIAKRDAARADIQRIHEQLKTVDPKDTVQKAKLYDQEQRNERVVQFENASLKKQLESLKGE